GEGRPGEDHRDQGRGLEVRSGEGRLAKAGAPEVRRRSGPTRGVRAIRPRERGHARSVGSLNGGTRDEGSRNEKGTPGGQATYDRTEDVATHVSGDTASEVAPNRLRRGQPASPLTIGSSRSATM